MGSTKKIQIDCQLLNALICFSSSLESLWTCLRASTCVIIALKEDLTFSAAGLKGRSQLIEELSSSAFQRSKVYIATLMSLLPHSVHILIGSLLLSLSMECISSQSLELSHIHPLTRSGHSENDNRVEKEF